MSEEIKDMVPDEEVQETPEAPEEQDGKEPGKREKKKQGKKKVPAPGSDLPKKPSFFSEVKTEMKRVTWPTKRDVTKWGLIVIAALAFFAAFTTLSDNFIVTPVMYFISGLFDATEFGIVPIILTVIMFISGVLLLITIMMHSGGDGGGLSDAASASMSSNNNSTAVVEKNLDRITIILAVIFVLSLIGLMVFFPQGTIAR